VPPPPPPTPPPRLPMDPIGEARRHWESHGWGEAAEGMTMVTSLMRAQQIVLARVEEVLRPTGLTFARYELLMLLLFSRTGALPMKKASMRLQVHPTSITNAVDRLESAGLVRRTPHPEDGRATLVEITPTGRETALRATGQLNAAVFEDPGLGARKARSLIAVITDLRRAAGDF
jgi:DNA-binding MarR family transcriptional regulator